MRFPFWLTNREFSGRKLRFFFHILPVVLASGFCIFIELASYTREQAVKNQTYAIVPSIKIFPSGLTPGSIIQNGSGEKNIDQEIPGEIERKFNKHVRIAEGRLLFRHEINAADFPVTGIDPSGVIASLKNLTNLGDDEAALGPEAAKKINASEGDTLRIGAVNFRIRNILPPEGSYEDTAVCITLRTAQKMTLKPGKINEINIYMVPGISQKEISGILRNEYPYLTVKIIGSTSAEVNSLDSILSRYSTFFKGISMLVIILYIFTIAFLNARERKLEIATLYAMGTSARGIIVLSAARSFITGALGSVTGCILSSVLIIIYDYNSSVSFVLNYKMYVVIVTASMAVSVLAALPAALVSGYRNHVQILQESWG